jgi:hypothetical protein
MAAKQRFCCAKHRVYANREGLYGNTAEKKPRRQDDGDTTVAAALAAAQAYTTVHVADTKAVAAIRIKRHGPAPSTWEVAMPSNSHVAAGRIREDLAAHIDDLVTLANKLGVPAGEQRLFIGTRKR